MAVLQTIRDSTDATIRDPTDASSKLPAILGAGPRGRQDRPPTWAPEFGNIFAAPKYICMCVYAYKEFALKVLQFSYSLLTLNFSKKNKQSV